MHPHIFGSLQGYPGKMGSFLTGGNEHLLEGTAEAHGPYFRKHVHDYDSMIQSLYEIHQKENESIEEYMLRVHARQSQ